MNDRRSSLQIALALRLRHRISAVLGGATLRAGAHLLGRVVIFQHAITTLLEEVQAQ